MVGYMSVEEQVDADFSRARRRAFLRRISARLRKSPIPNRLLCFEEVRRKLGVAGGVRRGRRTVRLTDIVGSVSRCSEFDGSFLPLREGARTKWERIDRAFVRGEELPPVSLYKIGSSYFHGEPIDPRPRGHVGRDPDLGCPTSRGLPSASSLAMLPAFPRPQME
jgi:hypothetical protein